MRMYQSLGQGTVVEGYRLHLFSVLREGYRISPISEVTIRNHGPQAMDVPLQATRAAGIAPYVLCDTAKYVFGVEKFKRNEFEKRFLKSSGKNAAPEHTVLAENEKEVALVHQTFSGLL